MADRTVAGSDLYSITLESINRQTWLDPRTRECGCWLSVTQQYVLCPYHTGMEYGIEQAGGEANP